LSRPGSILAQVAVPRSDRFHRHADPEDEERG
jgi:hypothetical protein